jgi:hypothetical protein
MLLVFFASTSEMSAAAFSHTVMFLHPKVLATLNGVVINSVSVPFDVSFSEISMRLTGSSARPSILAITSLTLSPHLHLIRALETSIAAYLTMTRKYKSSPSVITAI